MAWQVRPAYRRDTRDHHRHGPRAVAVAVPVPPRRANRCARDLGAARRQWSGDLLGCPAANGPREVPEDRPGLVLLGHLHPVGRQVDGVFALTWQPPRMMIRMGEPSDFLRFRMATG